MHKLEKTLNRIAGKTRIFLNPGVKSTRLSFSENFFLNESVVKIFRRKATLWVELHESYLQRLTLNRTFPRLLKVLRFYPQGLSRILDHTKKTSGETAFYLDLSDAGVTYTRPIPADANLYAFARHQDQPGIGLIPDPYSLGDMSWYFHFTRYSSKEEARTAYEQRKNQIFWRGSSTGQLNSMDVHSNDRIKFCIDALEFPEQIIQLTIM